MNGDTLEADIQEMDGPLAFHTAFGNPGNYSLRASIEDHTHHKTLRCVGDVFISGEHGDATA